MAVHETAEAYEPIFTGRALERLQQILPHYPTKQAALLPALWLVQEARGWISDRDMAEVGEVLGVTPEGVPELVKKYK
jgi:NADH:ubiquinone oxidoreductase subunit E